MFFVYRPQTPSGSGSRRVNARSPSPARAVYPNYNPDEAFVEFKRREYIAALAEAEQRIQFRRELATEEARHRQALEHIAAQEAVRRQHAEALLQEYSQEAQQADQVRQAQHAQRALQERQERQARERQAIEAEQAHLHPNVQRRPHPNQPNPQEILRRRLERQKEEERCSREFHRQILSNIFGAPVDIQESQTPVQRPKELPQEVQQQQGTVNEPSQSDTEEPHWSEAPQRARALAEIASINRAFLYLKNTFSFPAGQLERVANSEVPKLAYNPTNATIHAYEHALTDLLSKLDAIESHGFKGVRMARKQLVVKIEEELLALERKIAENLAPAAPSTAAAAAVPVVQDVEMSEAPSHTPNPAGYDVDVEDVFVAPTPSTGGGSTTTENTATATNTTADNAPLVNAPEVPSQEPQDQMISDAQVSAPAETPTEPTIEPTTDASATPAVDVNLAAPVPIAPAASASTDVTATNSPAVSAKHAPTISVSDEEDEIDDAVHVITAEDGTKAKASEVDGYELL